MTTRDKFELLDERYIEEYRSWCRRYRHRQTGAALFSMENEDENKVFGITFRTPPPSSNGLPHILEHSVLCGSQKYPVKKPFVELLKGSLFTFLNAMTFPDKTVYPVASQNLQDFYNLVDVYLDAVLHPKLAPHILAQEGWHYDLETPDSDLAYKGVVYNEMKGAYSSPENILSRYNRRNLFPETSYRHDSGGQPSEIVKLNFTEFRDFHSRYYHPSNARIFFYGDDDPERRLDIIDHYLAEFGYKSVNSTIDLQSYSNHPAQYEIPYDASQESDSARCFIAVNWLLPESRQIELSLAFSVLAHVLIGTPASPLRKALFDSGLGEDLTGDGLEMDLIQMYFSTGLKGVRREDSEKVEPFILKTLGQITEEGIDPGMIAAAINTIEFRLRENNTGSFPRGLLILFRTMHTWLYDGNPFESLTYNELLKELKLKVAQQPRFFEELVQKYLIENQHRVTVILTPDPDLRARQEASIKAELAGVEAKLSANDKHQLWEQAQELKQIQMTPDPPEALAKIPVLTLSDLDPENRPIPLEELSLNGIPLIFHDLFTNDIVYLDLGFDLTKIPGELLPLVPLFGRALLEIGTQTQDYVQLSQRIGRETGGIRISTFTGPIRNSKASAGRMFLRGKATTSQATELLNIVRDVIKTVQLDNQDRFKQMVLEEKAQVESSLIPAGHSYVNLRLKAHFNASDWAGEQMSGVAYLISLRQLAQDVEQDWSGVLEKLIKLQDQLLNRRGLILNLTLDQASFTKIKPGLLELAEQIPSSSIQDYKWPNGIRAGGEGFSIPAQVNYVGKGAPLFDSGYRLHGSSLVITHYLRTAWLWDQVRVQGGAYGGYSFFDHRTGMFTYLSYRDPNLEATLKRYDETPKFLRKVTVSQDELTKAIIGVIGKLDAYQLPDAKGYTSLLRFLIGDDDHYRQQLRLEILATNVQDFREFADYLDWVRSNGEVVVIGSQDKLLAALEAHPGMYSISKLL